MEISKCPICYKNFLEDKMIQTDCNHSFCIECITKWLSKNNTCPLCRSHIPFHKFERKFLDKIKTMQMLTRNQKKKLVFIYINYSLLNIIKHIKNTPDKNRQIAIITIFFSRISVFKEYICKEEKLRKNILKQLENFYMQTHNPRFLQFIDQYDDFM